MKKACISLFLLFIIVLTIISGYIKLNETVGTEKEYLRLHIRADSNSQTDQSVKYKVKDAVVKYLTPIICEIKSKESCEKILNSKKGEIERVADEVLKANGFNYTATAEFKTEEFPTRVYKDLTLNQGVYRALIINLGSGKGDNWWCVLYPPLCFDGETEVKYKSKIIEIIKDFKNKIKK